MVCLVSVTQCRLGWLQPITSGLVELEARLPQPHGAFAPQPSVLGLFGFIWANIELTKALWASMCIESFRYKDIFQTVMCGNLLCYLIGTWVMDWWTSSVILSNSNTFKTFLYVILFVLQCFLTKCEEKVLECRRSEVKMEKKQVHKIVFTSLASHFLKLLCEPEMFRCSTLFLCNTAAPEKSLPGCAHSAVHHRFMPQVHASVSQFHIYSSSAETLKAAVSGRREAALAAAASTCSM